MNTIDEGVGAQQIFLTVDDFVKDREKLFPETMPREMRDELLNLMRDMYVDPASVDRGKDHVRAAPVLEVFSVLLKPSDKSFLEDDKPWEVYGSIKVTDGAGESYDIYNYDEDEPEFIDEFYVQNMSLDRAVPITLYQTEPIFNPLPKTRLEARLWDKVRGIELANESISFDHLDRNGFEEEAGVKVVRGKHGSASVHYHFFPAAVYALVNVEAYKVSDGLEDDTIDVYGKVVALRDGGATGSYEVELFDEMAESSVKVKSPDSIGLRRTYVAVPAYSSLTIGVQLCDGDFHRVTFPSRECGFKSKMTVISDTLSFRVTVLLYPAYLKGSTLIPEKKNYPEVKASSERTKKIKLDVSASGCEKQSAVLRFHPAVELFSVYVVRHNHDQPLKLHGTIEFLSDKKCFIFNRNIVDGVSLVGKEESLELVGPSNGCFEGARYKVRVNLLDNQNREVCKGFVYINERDLDNPHTISWYDRRICSIISGSEPYADAYAAIHYTVFSEAVQASVKVLFRDSSSNAIQVANVSGRIVARYSNYFYKTSSDKDRYSSVLFSEHHLKLSPDNMIQLPLAKSTLPVPKECALIISVDLLVRTPYENSEGHILKDIAEFEIGARSHWMICDKGCAADVSIEWKGFEGY